MIYKELINLTSSEVVCAVCVGVAVMGQDDVEAFLNIQGIP